MRKNRKGFTITDMALSISIIATFILFFGIVASNHKGIKDGKATHRNSDLELEKMLKTDQNFKTHGGI